MPLTIPVGMLALFVLIARHLSVSGHFAPTLCEVTFRISDRLRSSPSWQLDDPTIGYGYCGMVSAKSLRPAAAKACILASRSAVPVSSVMARSMAPATARHEWPAGSP